MILHTESADNKTCRKFLRSPLSYVVLGLLTVGFWSLLYNFFGGGNPIRSVALFVHQKVTPPVERTITCGHGFSFLLRKSEVFVGGNRFELGTSDHLEARYELELFLNNKRQLLNTETSGGNPLSLDIPYGFTLHNNLKDVGDMYYGPSSSHLTTGVLPINFIVSANDITKDELKLLTQCVRSNEEELYQYAANYLYTAPTIRSYYIRGVYAVSVQGALNLYEKTPFTCARGMQAYMGGPIFGSGQIVDRGQVVGQFVVFNDGVVGPSFFLKTQVEQKWWRQSYLPVPAARG